MLFHHVERKCIVPGGNRRMRCKDACGSNLFGGFLKRLSLLHQFASAFEQHESRMTLVRMKHTRLNSESTQNAYAANSENNFLADAMFLVAAVKARRQFPVTLLVFFDVGVHQ